MPQASAIRGGFAGRAGGLPMPRVTLRRICVGTARLASGSGIREAYASVAGLREDEAQRIIVERLARLQESLVSTDTPWRRVRSLPFVPQPEPVPGLYLWGDVGRGKTFLMDLFYETLPLARKKRRHFHRMMRDVHAGLRSLKSKRDPLDAVAAGLASEARVLCFDEFFVSDIGDAMILGRLLDGLFRRGVTLVATSNVPPSDLYPGGLQRQRFLPAVRLLEAHTQVVELAGGYDYRLALLKRAGTYLVPDDAANRERLAGLFDGIAPGRVQADADIDVNGRPVAARRIAKGVAWFEFAELCEGPRATADYVEIARCYHTVIVTGVPVLDRTREDPARRFIALVDEFYDRRVKLLVSAARPADALYAGRRLGFEFQRTISRLSEMQSREYLHAAHRA